MVKRTVEKFVFRIKAFMAGERQGSWLQQREQDGRAGGSSGGAQTGHLPRKTADAAAADTAAAAAAAAAARTITHALR